MVPLSGHCILSCTLGCFDDISFYNSLALPIKKKLCRSYLYSTSAVDPTTTFFFLLLYATEFQLTSVQQSLVDFSLAESLPIKI